MKPGIPGSGEGVLANFFNSLLNKKSPGNLPSAIKGGGDATVSNAEKAAMRSDAAAELERLSRTKKTETEPEPEPEPEPDSSEC